MIGAGMTLTGSCPGTVYAQLGGGVESGVLVLAGAVLGGILYTGISNRLKTQRAKEESPDRDLTIPEKTNIDADVVLLSFVGFCAATVATSSRYSPKSTVGLLSPIVGGLLMGGSQLMSVLLRRTTLGISGSYEELGRWFWKAAGLSKDRPSSSSINFAIGTTFGSWAISTVLPKLKPFDSTQLMPLRTIFGGMVMAFGSRLAGGCTSGHGISGMALLGVPSTISVISMFAGAFALARFID
jgi:uncharacterized membrane protein YedE/YeeE